MALPTGDVADVAVAVALVPGRRRAQPGCRRPLGHCPDADSQLAHRSRGRRLATEDAQLAADRANVHLAHAYLAGEQLPALGKLVEPADEMGRVSVDVVALIVEIPDQLTELRLATGVDGGVGRPPRRPWSLGVRCEARHLDGTGADVVELGEDVARQEPNRQPPLGEGRRSEVAPVILDDLLVKAAKPGSMLDGEDGVGAGEAQAHLRRPAQLAGSGEGRGVCVLAGGDPAVDVELALGEATEVVDTDPEHCGDLLRPCVQRRLGRQVDDGVARRPSHALRQRIRRSGDELAEMGHQHRRTHDVVVLEHGQGVVAPHRHLVGMVERLVSEGRLAKPAQVPGLGQRRQLEGELTGALVPGAGGGAIKVVVHDPLLQREVVPIDQAEPDALPADMDDAADEQLAQARRRSGGRGHVEEGSQHRPRVLQPVPLGSVRAGIGEAPGRLLVGPEVGQANLDDTVCSDHRRRRRSGP